MTMKAVMMNAEIDTSLPRRFHGKRGQCLLP
jgi:hypothetical protein